MLLRYLVLLSPVASTLLTSELINPIHTIFVAITDLTHVNASPITAAERSPGARGGGGSRTYPRIFIRAVQTVSVPITYVAAGHTVAISTSELVLKARVVGAVGFVRVVPAVVLTVTKPKLQNAQTIRASVDNNNNNYYYFKNITRGKLHCYKILFSQMVTKWWKFFSLLQEAKFQQASVSSYLQVTAC